MPESEFSRRDFLRYAAGAAAALAVEGSVLSGCGDDDEKPGQTTEKLPDSPPTIEEELRRYGLEREVDIKVGSLTFAIYGMSDRLSSNFLPTTIKGLSELPVFPVRQGEEEFAAAFEEATAKQREGTMPSRTLHLVLDYDPRTCLVPTKEGLEREKTEDAWTCPVDNWLTAGNGPNESLVVVPYFTNGPKVVTMGKHRYQLNEQGMTTFVLDTYLVSELVFLGNGKNHADNSVAQQNFSIEMARRYMVAGYKLREEKPPPTPRKPDKPTPRDKPGKGTNPA